MGHFRRTARNHRFRPCQRRSTGCNSGGNPVVLSAVEGSVSGVSLPVEQQVAHVADRLVDDFSGRVDDSEVRSLVTDG